MSEWAYAKLRKYIFRIEFHNCAYLRVRKECIATRVEGYRVPVAYHFASRCLCLSTISNWKWKAFDRRSVPGNRVPEPLSCVCSARSRPNEIAHRNEFGTAHASHSWSILAIFSVLVANIELRSKQFSFFIFEINKCVTRCADIWIDLWTGDGANILFLNALVVNCNLLQIR